MSESVFTQPEIRIVAAAYHVIVSSQLDSTRFAFKSAVRVWGKKLALICSFKSESVFTHQPEIRLAVAALHVILHVLVPSQLKSTRFAFIS